MVSPLSLVVDVDALLALTSRLDHRAVGLNDGFVEKLVRLLLPDFLSCLIEDVHQTMNGTAVEAAAEVSSGRWVGNTLRPQRIEVVLVVAPAVPDVPGRFLRPRGCKPCSGRGPILNTACRVLSNRNLLG